MASKRSFTIAAAARALALGGLLLLSGCDSVEERVAEHYQRGLELKREGDPVKAALEFRNAIQLDNQFAPAHFEYGVLLSEQGDMAQAARQFLATLDSEPEHVAARSAVAQLMLMSNQLDEALKHSTAAVKIAPDDPDILALHATVCYRVGDIDAALENAQKAIKLRPGHPIAGAILVANRLEKEGAPAALSLLDGFIAANAGDPAQARGLNLIKLGILTQQGDQEAIRAHLTAMVALYPSETNFRRALAAWHVENGSPDEAETQLRAIAELDPTDVGATLELVQFLVDTKGADAGRAELQRRIGQAEDPFPLRFALARMDQEHGRAEEAEALLREMISTEEALEEPHADKLAAARIQLARFLAARDEKADARILVDEVLATDSKNVEGLALRAAFLLEEDALDKAIETLRAALAESPNNARLLRLAALAYERDGRTELAREALSSAMEISGFESAYVLSYTEFLRRSGNLSAAETVLAEATRRAPESREVLTALAQTQLELQHWAAAEGTAETLRKLDASGFAADRILAAALSGQKQYEESIGVLRGLSRAGDQKAATMRDLVDVYVEAGQRDKAKELVDDALSANPVDLQALLLRGELHKLDGEDDDAERRFLAAIDAAPTSIEGYTALITLYQAQNRLDEAEEVARRGLEIVSDPPALRLQLALILERKGQIDAAIEEYRTLYDTEPSSIVVANNYASLLSDHRADDPESVDTAFRVARRLRASEVPAFRDTYGWVLYLRGDFSQALESLSAAAAELPTNPWVRFHLGMTYAELGEVEKAREHLEAALQLAGDGGFSKSDAAQAALDKLPSPRPSGAD